MPNEMMATILSQASRQWDDKIKAEIQSVDKVKDKTDDAAAK
jgi:hypothetical protein